jgi:hypothetical protein
MRKPRKNRKSKTETFKVIGEGGEVTIVTRTIVPAGKFPTPEKFRKANEMLEKAIMLPS